jgi:hypothetical protein
MSLLTELHISKAKIRKFEPVSPKERQTSEINDQELVQENNIGGKRKMTMSSGHNA